MGARDTGTGTEFEGRMSDAARCLLVVAMLQATGSSVLAQAGSTGGAIGKTEKSISGSERSTDVQPAAKTRANNQRPAQAGNGDRSGESSVAGRWRWTQDCSIGRWQGEFELSETSGGSFSGNFAGTSWHDIGTISGGRVSGSSISFTRTNPVTTQYWRGRLAGGRMSGSSTGNADCSWQASRK